jgi:hypothetical protein
MGAVHAFEDEDHSSLCNHHLTVKYRRIKARLIRDEDTFQALVREVQQLKHLVNVQESRWNAVHDSDSVPLD